MMKRQQISLRPFQYGAPHIEGEENATIIAFTNAQ